MLMPGACAATPGLHLQGPPHQPWHLCGVTLVMSVSICRWRL